MSKYAILGAALLDAFGVYHFVNSPFALKFGQFKDPIWHERNLNEASLLAVDRSYVESLLGGGQTGRVQGAALVYDKDRLRTQVVFHDGFNSINTKFFDDGGIGSGVGSGAGVTPTDFGLSASCSEPGCISGLLVPADAICRAPFGRQSLRVLVAGVCLYWVLQPA